MKEVVVLARSFSRASPEPLAILEKAGCQVNFKSNPEPDNEEVVANLIGGAPAVIVGVDRIGKEVFDRCPQLKVISKHGVGVDNIDLDQAKARGVVVANAPGTNSDSVADMALTLILAFARRLPYLFERIKEKQWSSPEMGLELRDKTLGVVGLGRIGRGVAERALGFGMKILFYDPIVTAEQATSFQKVSLPYLFEHSDIISLHAPLTPETQGMVDEPLLSRMKKEAYLVNTARGELINEEALFRFLKEEKIAGAALDVLSAEPPFLSPLLTLPNVIVTPHKAAHTREANIKMGKVAATNVVRVLAGEEPLFRVV